MKKKSRNKDWPSDLQIKMQEKAQLGRCTIQCTVWTPLPSEFVFNLESLTNPHRLETQSQSQLNSRKQAWAQPHPQFFLHIYKQACATHLCGLAIVRINKLISSLEWRTEAWWRVCKAKGQAATSLARCIFTRSPNLHTRPPFLLCKSLSEALWM